MKIVRNAINPIQDGLFWGCSRMGRGVFLILLTVLESLVTALINMVTILMMSAKITTPDLLKIRAF